MIGLEFLIIEKWRAQTYLQKRKEFNMWNKLLNNQSSWLYAQAVTRMAAWSTPPRIQEQQREEELGSGIEKMEKKSQRMANEQSKRPQGMKQFM